MTGPPWSWSENVNLLRPVERSRRHASPQLKGRIGRSGEQIKQPPASRKLCGPVHAACMSIAALLNANFIASAGVVPDSDGREHCFAALPGRSFTLHFPWQVAGVIGLEASVCLRNKIYACGCLLDRIRVTLVGLVVCNNA